MKFLPENTTQIKIFRAKIQWESAERTEKYEVLGIQEMRQHIIRVRGGRKATDNVGGGGAKVDK